MYQYILCQFEYGYDGFLYQEVLNGDVIRHTDMDGNTLELIPPYGYFVISDKIEKPQWSL